MYSNAVADRISFSFLLFFCVICLQSDMVSGKNAGGILEAIQEEEKLSLLTLFVLAVGLSMDAFAVAICKGLGMKKITIGRAAVVGLWFGGFQAGMPFAGYILGIQFKAAITTIDHWIAFVLLGLIGINMIREALSEEECAGCSEEEASLEPKEMFMLAVATSIDALAVGVTFAFLDVDIVPAVSFIGITTFVLSMAGVKVGNIFGEKYEARAEIAGGVILVLLGVKILMEHLGVV